MAEYRRSAHAVFDLKYHVVWITKYRYKILRGRVAERARDLIRQSCEAREVVIMRGAVSPDHIHMLLSAPARRWARWTRQRSRHISRTRSGTKTIRASRLQRPPSLEPVVFKELLT